MHALIQPEIDVIRNMIKIIAAIDCSGSMTGEKIAAANYAMRESTHEIKLEANNHPEVDFQLGCIEFSDFADWHIPPQPADQVTWKDLYIAGGTYTGSAILKMTEAIKRGCMPNQAYPPVLILISDGQNTDGKNYEEAIEVLKNEYWGRNAIRIAIGIGDDYDHDQLAKFVSNPEIGVLNASTPAEIVNHIRYATIYTTRNVINNRTSPAQMIHQLGWSGSSISDGEFQRV